jgi:exopolysaccharide production protein ExoZ
VINSIQLLRFLAAGMVVLAHCDMRMYEVTPFKLGGFGVDIFFVISGFIMPFVAFGGLRKDPSEFVMSASYYFLRRIIRILPIYFIATAAVIVGSLIVNSGFFQPNVDLAYAYAINKVDVGWFLQSITFTSWDRPPILAIGWTLNLEFLFYAFVSLLIAVKIHKTELFEMLWCFIFYISTAIILIFNQSWVAIQIQPLLKNLGYPLMLEFAFGIILYRYASNEVLLPKKIALAIFIFTIPVFLLLQSATNISVIAGEYYRPFSWGVFAFALVWAGLSLENKISIPKLFVILGDVSYSLYLVHWLLTSVISYLWFKAGLHANIPVYLYIFVYYIICQLVALLVHSRIEKPISKFLKKKIEVFAQ